MKKSELIEKLNAISEEDFEVALFDERRNLHNADSGPSGVGVHADFKVELYDNVDEDDAVNTPQFIALSFTNDDYNEDGNLNEKK